MSFTQMLEGIVEYLDVYEEDTIHVEQRTRRLDPTLMLILCRSDTLLELQSGSAQYVPGT